MTCDKLERKHKIKVYGRTYPVRVVQKVCTPPECPRLVVVAFQPNDTAKEILRLCIESIRRHTPEDYELWVVDNDSPLENARWLEDEPGINVIFNGSLPQSSVNIVRNLFGMGAVQYLGSYANAVALELAAQIINQKTKLMMTLHMDTMPCQPGWLSYLVSRLNDNVRCVGVRLDSVRVNTVHVLGMMFDFSLFSKLGLTFAHNMPHYDTGDGISLTLVRAGYGIWACPNSLWEPELVEKLPIDSPFRGLMVDRSFDEDGKVVFLHLGRGVLKSNGEQSVGKATADEWLKFGREIILCQ